MGYLELKSLIQKYKAGDNLLVKLKRNEISKKGAKLKDKFEEKDHYLEKNCDASPTLLFDANTIEKKFSEEYDLSRMKKLYTNDKRIYELIKAFNKQINIEYKNVDFIDEFGLLTEFENIFKKKIWLKSGGNIVIDKTEALTAIDVNVAKSAGKKEQDRWEIIFETNKEAAIEIVRQIRLKDITGMIVVDFINFRRQSDKDEIIEVLEKEVKSDRKSVNIYGFTRLGLCEMTRSSNVINNK